MLLLFQQFTKNSYLPFIYIFLETIKCTERNSLFLMNEVNELSIKNEVGILKYKIYTTPMCSTWIWVIHNCIDFLLKLQNGEMDTILKTSIKHPQTTMPKMKKTVIKLLRSIINMLVLLLFIFLLRESILKLKIQSFLPIPQIINLLY